MCILYGFALLFGAGAVYNLFRGNFVNVAWGLGFAFVLFVFGSLLGHEEARAEEFEKWLLNNKTALLDGETLDFEGQNIALTTQLARYEWLLSFVIASSSQKTRYLVRGTTKTKLSACFCCVLTLIFGWWSLPTGPLETFWTLGKNARGGEKTDVARLLNELVKANSNS